MRGGLGEGGGDSHREGSAAGRPELRDGARRALGSPPRRLRGTRTETAGGHQGQGLGSRVEAEPRGGEGGARAPGWLDAV